MSFKIRSPFIGICDIVIAERKKDRKKRSRNNHLSMNLELLLVGQTNSCDETMVSNVLNLFVSKLDTHTL